MKSDIKDFIGIFDDVVSKEFCNDVIDYYRYVQNASLTCSRQAAEGVEKFKKQDDTYFFQDEMQQEFQLHNTNILQEANRAFADCINAYFNHYDILYSTNYGVYSYRLQKTPINGGYHVWHHERGDLENQHRMLAMILYLNDVDDGGETEFHYYPRRVQAKAGRVLICPADFTHTHRGNPPLSNEKYIITTWASHVK